MDYCRDQAAPAGSNLYYSIVFHAPAHKRILNSLFAVGLVSLPGMMTGQILSGVSPFIAARYQIMVMCMLFTASGFSAILFLIAAKSSILQIQSSSEPE